MNIHVFKIILHNKYGSNDFIINMELGDTGWLVNIFNSAHPYITSVRSLKTVTSL